MQIFLFHKFQSTFLVAGQMSFLKTTVDQPLSKKQEYRYLAAVSFEVLCQNVKMTGGAFESHNSLEINHKPYSSCFHETVTH